jgi:Asp-tRNA(Asn)/Glu-tRNA(Gln) amidotransferase A subunit family amidase
VSYQRDPVNAPTLRGTPFRLFVETLEGPLGRSVLRKIASGNGLERFRAQSAGDAPVTQAPLPHPANAPTAPADPLALAAEVAGDGGGPVETVARFAQAYRSGEASPSAVAERVLAAMEKLGHLRAFITSYRDDVRAQAEASERRFREGRPLSVFEGVPVAVKDEMDQRPYPTSLGTSFLGRVAAAADATMVARLRAAGALLIGKANMHEIGINVFGINPHHGATRNPWDPKRITGGSSSGPAAAVAAGLCPVAAGADGGGSIRIPAALCGVVGLKPTWGRVSERGVFPLCWTVGHVGPIGATVRDVAAAYAIVAGADPLEPLSQAQPHVELGALSRVDLRGVRLGVARPWFEDAHPAVVRRCREALQHCEAQGATIVEVPPPDLNTVLWTHAVIILSEMATAMWPHIQEGIRRFGLDARANLALARYFSSTDYVHALRHRHRLTVEWLKMMQTVDAVITPTTAITAPEISEGALPAGETNLPLTDALMRFVRLPNITGFPALSVPAGFDDAAMPVGLQLIGRPWEEALLLRIGLAVEGRAERRTPREHVRLLG